VICYVLYDMHMEGSNIIWWWDGFLSWGGKWAILHSDIHIMILIGNNFSVMWWFLSCNHALWISNNN